MQSSVTATNYGGVLARAYESYSSTPPRTCARDGGIVTELIDSRRMEPGACFETYRDCEREVYDVFAANLAPEKMQMYVQSTDLAGLGFSQFRASIHGVRRTAAHVRRTPIEALRVRLYRSGVTHALFGDKPVTMQAGTIHVVDYSQPSHAISADVDQISLYVPHDLIGYDPSRHPAYWAIAGDAPLGRMIATAMEMFEQQLPCLSADNAPAVAEGLRGMLAGGLSGGLHSHDDRPVQQARAAAMRQHLDRNLRDPDLGISALACAFGASRATIFRDFADYGGVDHYIADRRLTRAYVDLAEATVRRGAVARAAADYGFCSTSHFSRLFLEKFRCRPGEVVGLRSGA